MLAGAAAACLSGPRIAFVAAPSAGDGSSAASSVAAGSAAGASGPPPQATIASKSVPATNDATAILARPIWVCSFGVRVSHLVSFRVMKGQERPRVFLGKSMTYAGNFAFGELN